MNRTARAILSKTPDRRQRLVYGVMASATTVFIEGSAIAVTVPQLSSAGVLATNDHVALQKFGTDTLIIGRVASPKVNQVQRDRASYTTNSSGVFQVTFPNAFTAPPVMSAIIEDTSGQIQVISVYDLTASLVQFRMWQGTSLLVSDTRVVHWQARGTLA